MSGKSYIQVIILEGGWGEERKKETLYKKGRGFMMAHQVQLFN